MAFWTDPIDAYDDNILYNLVYRFTVAYENGLAPRHKEAFAIKNRTQYAKMAYNLWKEYKKPKKS